jgi:regulator of replication initiation timing
VTVICVLLILALCVVSCHDYWNNSDANARVADAWKQLSDMRDRRDALVVENTELQRRLETIEDALGERE